MRLSRWLLGPALILSLVSVPVVADASPDHRQTSAPAPAAASAAADDLTATPLAKPKVTLDGPQRGKAALKALGSRLGIAAGINGTSVQKLQQVLAHDPTAWLGADGHLFYADRFDRPDLSARRTSSSAAASVPPAPEPLADTFTLHSIPGGADHTVYLDFNGVYLGTSGWTLNGWKKGTYPGFSLDSDYSTFSEAERAYIQHVWQVVAEKYAPFDIDVTTQDPGHDGYNRNGLADPKYGDHVVFTDVTTGSGAKPASVCPEGCDGISFNDSFDDPDDDLNLSEPTWVYTDYYHWYSGIPGEIAAHEIGHTLGLDHDGLGAGDDSSASNASYYGGNDQWSPVMGAGVGALTQFSKGEYANASNTQDDFAVMQTHGVSLRSDDWGDPGSPSALGQALKYEESGVLEDAADQDVFTIDRTCTGPLDVRASGIGAGQTADLRLRVLDATGTTVLGSDDPTSSFNDTTYPRAPRGVDAEVSLDSTASGLIQIEVDGVGSGDPLTGGYSDYGSVGRYDLTISGCGGVLGSVPGSPSLDADQSPRSTSLTVFWYAPNNVGDGPVLGYRITGMPSGTIDVPASQTSAVFRGLNPGQSYDIGVAAINAYGVGRPAEMSAHLSTWAPSSAPKLAISARNTTLIVDWTEPPNPGRAIGTQWTVKVYDSHTTKLLKTFHTDYGYSGLRVNGFGAGRYKLSVYLEYDANSGYRTSTANAYAYVGPSAPRIGTPSSGAIGGTKTATVRWAAPSLVRGTTITSYVIGAYKLDSHNHVVQVKVSSYRRPYTRSYTWTLPGGRYRFKVQAHSSAGWSPVSSYSKIVTAR